MDGSFAPSSTIDHDAEQVDSANILRFTKIIRADARSIPLSDDTVDLIVTSPPYWRKRDYGSAEQIGQEPTAVEYTQEMLACLKEWQRLLRPTGSIFLNIGDTYYKRTLAGIPGRIEAAALDDGWILRNRIIWAKSNGMPEAAQNKLASRHEYILHFVKSPKYYYDLYGYANDVGNGANPGDVWTIQPQRNMSRHLAPFPEEIARRAILLACPRDVCSICGMPRSRILERTTELDTRRPQAKRALQIAREAQLTEAHLRAVQATGVSDSGKALITQNGTGRNSVEVQRLASEAKRVLGGYFREFTFARRVTRGWTDCGHEDWSPGVVMDPFVGTGTTIRVAERLARSAIGVDISPPAEDS